MLDGRCVFPRKGAAKMRRQKKAHVRCGSNCCEKQSPELLLVKGGGRLCVRSYLSKAPVGRGFRSLQITDPFRNKRFPVKFGVADGLLHDHTIGG